MAETTQDREGAVNTGVPLRHIEDNGTPAPFALDGVERVWLVGHNAPLKELPFWKRVIIRATYFVTGWSTGDAVSAQTVCTTREIAQSFARDPSYFIVELPVDVNLPHDAVQFGEQNFPMLEEVEPNIFARYAARQQDVVFMPRQQFELLQNGVQGVLQAANKG